MRMKKTRFKKNAEVAGRGIEDFKVKPSIAMTKMIIVWEFSCGVTILAESFGIDNTIGKVVNKHQK